MSGLSLLLLAISSAAGLSVTASPPALNSGGLNVAGPFVTASVTAIPAGGTGPYTYFWSVTSEPLVGSIVINTPLGASTSCTVDGFEAGDTVQGTITCEVTDTANGHTATVDVVVRHRYFGDV